jgi:hypothetical protein
MISEQTVTFPSYIINILAFITEVENVYCAVRTESLYKLMRLALKVLNINYDYQRRRGDQNTQNCS